MPTLEEAIEHIRMGDRDTGRQMLEEILEGDENNEEVWLWLSSVVDTDEDREICLENVLALNPNNVVAQKGLEALQSGTFNVSELLSDVIEGEEGEEEESESTFIDDFMMADDDDDLIFPDSVAKPKKKSGGGINVRFIILGVLILVVVIVLGGVGAYVVLFSDGDGTPIESQTSPETPAEAGPPTETPTPAPTPTETPIPTDTPDFSLPTITPTSEPSPTATQVVSPTPGG